jgi:hypothetical protein
MPQSRFPTSLALIQKKKPDQTPKNGYVRSQATHIDAVWSFEILSDDQKIAVVTIETVDGPVHIGVNRSRAEDLFHQLQLFLENWPKDRQKS